METSTPAETFRPAYLHLPPGELARRADEAVQSLADCRACPRDCGVDRLRGKWAACKSGRYAVVSSAFPHLGEEDCLRGWRGSGTIFFSHCNLRCVFCQNFDISQGVRPPGRPAGNAAGGTHAIDPYGIRQPGARPEELAAMMLALQNRGCHNINFVTPEHVVPQVLEALALAVDRGLRLPIVYNTSAYDAMESLAWMDGVVDIYMPDFKLWGKEASKVYLKAEDYPEAARAAIREMHRQVGELVIDEDGVAQRGVLLRHLVMPGMLDETRKILTWIAEEVSRETFINLMDQYRPAGKVSSERYPELNSALSATEFQEAREIAGELGLNRLDERDHRPQLAAIRWLFRQERDEP